VQVVVGLESLESEEELLAISETFAWQPPIFSLDLHAGQPLVRNQAWRNRSALELALVAKSVGVREIIVLDLADVGVEQGTRTLDLCREIVQVTQTQRLIAGGGVRGYRDLEQMARAGITDALVASALHDGRLSPADIQRARSLGG
jgi:phosphoribosylformimino-5-aminoimidazole carboxamide ribotide isomerase